MPYTGWQNYMIKWVKNFEGNIDGESMIESCLYLGKYYKEKSLYEKAYNILMKLKDYEGSEKDEIHSLIKEINNLRSNNNGYLDNNNYDLV